MTTRERLEAEEAFLSYTQNERRLTDTVQAILGDGAGNVVVTNRPGWFYVRLRGDPDSVIEVWCPTSVPAIEGLAVDLEKVRTYGHSFYQIVGRSAFLRYPQDPFFASGITGAIGSHGIQHQRRDRGQGGFDPVDVYVRALTPLRAVAQSVPDMSVYVEPGRYYLKGWQSWLGGNSPTFSAPTAMPRWDLLYLDDTGTLKIASGTEAGTPDYPTIPANCIPIAFVYLVPGQTAIREYDIEDARLIVGGEGGEGKTAGGDLSGNYPNPTVVGLRGKALPIPTGTDGGKALTWSSASDQWLLASSGISVLNSGTYVGFRPGLNFIPGPNITLDITDNAAAERVDVSISAGTGGGGGGHTIQDEGVSLPQRSKLNFVGAGVTATDDATGDATQVTIPGGGHTIMDEGAPLPSRTYLDFTGSAVQVSDNQAEDKTVVKILAGEDVSVLCRASANQSIPTGVWTSVVFDLETFDTHGMHDSLSNPTRLTCVRTGKYAVFGGVIWDLSSTGARVLRLSKNNADFFAYQSTGPAGESNLACISTSALVDLVAGDYMELQAWHNAGAPLQILGQSRYFGMALLPGGGGTIDASLALFGLLGWA